MAPDDAPSVATGGGTSLSRAERRAQRQSAARPHWLLGLGVVAACVVLAGAGWMTLGRGNGSSRSTENAGTQLQMPTLTPAIPLSAHFPGTTPVLPFPSTGQSAVYVDRVGLLGATANQEPVPMASVTKVMTAVIVLHDHPLVGAGSGPTFTMTEADHQAWIHDSTHDDSNLMVVKGERLTERQLLEALMVPSADNVADYLARWDAGSIGKFVAKMSAEAARLGLHHTHYADASGLNPASASTAADQAKLGAFAMRDPTLVSIVDHPTYPFPLEGTVMNYNPVVGQDGVIGVKSGWTSAAQACLVTAAPRTVGGRTVLVVSSTLSQPLGLWQAGQIDLQLLDATTRLLESRVVVTAGQAVANVYAPWNHEHTTAVAATSQSVVGWPGLAVHVALSPVPPGGHEARHGWPAGTAIVTVRFETSGGGQASATGQLSQSVAAPPRGWVMPPAAAGATSPAAGAG